jgi:hypothetical protein
MTTKTTLKTHAFPATPLQKRPKIAKKRPLTTPGKKLPKNRFRMAHGLEE